MWWMTEALAAAAEPGGSWAIAANEADLAALHAAAVEEGLSKLPWAFRPVARGQLTGAVKNCRRLELATTATTLTTTCDGATDHVFTTTAPVTITSDGKPYSATLSNEGDVWTLLVSGDDGGQRITYERRDDATLVVTKQIFSGWMSEPFDWSVAYHRD